MAISLRRAVTVAAFLESVSANILPSFNYGTDKLVLESWITPSLFENTGDSGNIRLEWTFCEYQDTDTAKEMLQEHWSTWITEFDFADIAAEGLNHVRLLIGYWALPVSLLLPWRLSDSGWHSNRTNIGRSNDIFYKMSSMFADKVDMIEALNELSSIYPSHCYHEFIGLKPAGFYGDVALLAIKEYYYDGYPAVRSNQQRNALVLIHDAFQDLSYWKDFMCPEDKYDGVAMDIHRHQMFSNAVCPMCQEGLSLCSFHLWTIVGECTAAPIDCAKYLNGNYFDDSPKFGDCRCKTGSANGFSKEYKAFLRKYWEAQLVTYEKSTAGYIYWTWKAEFADDWSYQAGLAYGWIPRNLINRLYPNICG
ncbi:glycoside hydrolase [Guyanagaster necrorhizus]|uniref:Glycoside hydrolase n=1 Tax=Guyanagaster necrorhizus TaxID=856835 RepID=A0A9P8ATG2_9AGAR|nr:glycoside hydrolase [Guyanagaster necrorhizus MCA 3950]KAG7447408.1 glycoside hydrolase [Guyanagaster necrorhizus MCA 3950]